MTTVTGIYTKRAWIRNPGQPIGSPGVGRVNCPCGGAPESVFSEEQANVTCACGAVYQWDGVVIMTAKQSRTLRDARALSGGTIATLCGLRSYDQIEEIQNEWVAWLSEIHCPFDNWQDAWGAYWQIYWE